MVDRSKQVPWHQRPLSSPSKDFSLEPLRIDGSGDSGAKTAHRAKTAHKAKTHAWWTPSYLTKAALLVFMGTYISFAVVLAALFAYSSTHQGLSTASDHDYYLWTYGPTAGQLHTRSVRNLLLTSRQYSPAWRRSGPRSFIESSSSCPGKQCQTGPRLHRRVCCSITYLR